MSDLTSVIEFAVSKEDEFVKFYKLASDKSRFSRVKDMFLNLSNIKDEQQGKLKDILNEIRNQKSFLTDFQLESFMKLHKFEFSQGMSFNQLREEGIKIEEYSKIFYKKLETAVQIIKYKNIFQDFVIRADKNRDILDEHQFGK